MDNVTSSRPWILLALFAAAGCSQANMASDGKKIQGEPVKKSLTGDGADGPSDETDASGKKGGGKDDEANGEDEGSGKSGKAGKSGGGKNGNDAAVEDNGKSLTKGCAFLGDKVPQDETMVEVVGGQAAPLPVGKLLAADHGGQRDGNLVRFKFVTYTSNYDGKVYYSEDNVSALQQGMPNMAAATFRKQRYLGVVKNAASDDCSVVVEAQTMMPRETIFPHTGSGCFAPETLIRLADGSDRRVDLLSNRDLVLNPLTKQPQRIKELIVGPERHVGLIEVGFDGAKVVVTDGHPFFVKDGALKTAKQLSKDDVIRGADGRFHPVTHLVQRAADPQQVVYNLMLEGDSRDSTAHAVLADGVVTGDLHLQRQLESHKVAAK